MKNNFKIRSFYVLAFFVPIIIFFGSHIVRGIHPFGDASILVLDLNAQYIYYYEAFRDALLNGKSLFYSFSRTLGGEMMGTLAYYIASPFSFIFLIFPKTMITESVLIMILCKVGCSGLSFYYYLRKTRDSKPLYTLIFSTLYALSGYVIVQTMNPMWLDAVLFLPLIALSIERMVKENKNIWYIVFLGVTLIANFYIGYMVGIFIVVYFFYALVLYGQDLTSFKKKILLILKFAYSSAISIGLSLWLIIPTYYSLKMGKFTFTEPNFMPSQKLDLFDVFVKMLPLSYDSVNYHGLPFIYCGFISLILIGIYFLNKKISNREKIGSLFLVGVVITSFTVSTIDIVLHGLQAPNWLNYRYSFILVFILLKMAYDAFINIKESSNRDIWQVTTVIVLLIVMVGRASYDFVETEVMIWTSFGLLFLYALMLYIFKNSVVQWKKVIATTILISIIALELFANSLVLMYGANSEVLYSTRSSYRDYFDKLYSSVEYMEENDSGFYRSETEQHRTVNDPMELGIYGLSNSSSLLNSSVIELLKDLGLCSREHWTKYKGSTVLLDSVLGVKYVISEDIFNTVYEEKFVDNEITLYENPYALPIAFPVNEAYKELVLDSKDPFVNQNVLLSTLAGKEETQMYFDLLEITDVELENLKKVRVAKDNISYTASIAEQNAHIEYTVKTKVGKEIYMYIVSDYPRKANIWLNGEFIDTFFDYESTCILPLGAFEETSFELIVTPTEADFYVKNTNIYYLDEKLFSETIDEINNIGTVVEKVNERKLNISTTASENQIMYTSIPYEKGWTVIVNSKEVETFVTLDSLLSFELEEGNNEIEMIFTPEGFVVGLIASLTAFVALIILVLVDLLKKRKNRKFEKEYRKINSIK